MTRFSAASIVAGGVVLGLVVCAPPSRADEETAGVKSDTVIVSPREMASKVEVRDVHKEGNTITGTIVNTSDQPIRDVQLLVRYLWLWRPERRPGKESPTRAYFETVPGELAPGQTASFSYQADVPLEPRRNGRFVPDVQVSAVTQLPPGSATSGVGGGMH